jgi:DNA-binding XRE family transcriptional regulator
MYATHDVASVRQTSAPPWPYGHPVPPKRRSEEFAQLLRAARDHAGLTQEALAASVGVHRSTIVRWEGGDATLTDPSLVRAVCLKLGIDPREAAVALGYLTAEDLTPTDVQRQPLDPTLAAIVAKLRDPSVSEQDKQAAASYIAYLHSQARSRREAAS